MIISIVKNTVFRIKHFIFFSFFLSETKCEHGFWTGARRIGQSLTFYWRDNTRLDRNSNYWTPGQPDFAEGKERCVEMRKPDPHYGRLNDHHCSVRKEYICQSMYNSFCFIQNHVLSNFKVCDLHPNANDIVCDNTA